jgi:hypothetical protein
MSTPVVKVQDWNRTVSQVFAVAMGPDGKPALLPLDVPPWDYREITWTGSNPTTIVYKQGGSSGTTVLTEVNTFDGNGNCTTTTRTYA